MDVSSDTTLDGPPVFSGPQLHVEKARRALTIMPICHFSVFLCLIFTFDDYYSYDFIILYSADGVTESISTEPRKRYFTCPLLLGMHSALEEGYRGALDICSLLMYHTSSFYLFL